MKSIWITIVILSFMISGCGPQARIQKTYLHVEKAKTGVVDVFTSFDGVGEPYKKVAELKVKSQLPPNKDTDAMIESLKTKARKLGADGIVIVEEGKFIERVSLGPGMGGATFYNHFIICTAIVYD